MNSIPMRNAPSSRRRDLEPAAGIIVEAFHILQREIAWRQRLLVCTVPRLIPTSTPPPRDVRHETSMALLLTAGQLIAAMS